MLDYIQKVFLGFLEKDPGYTLPPPPKYSPGEVGVVRPLIDAVGLRCHGNEKAVAVEGSNLWFCYQISVGGHPPVKTPPQDLSGSSIQFNIPEGKQLMTECNRVNVTTHSHFAKPNKEIVPLSEKKVSSQEQMCFLCVYFFFVCVYFPSFLHSSPIVWFKILALLSIEIWHLISSTTTSQAYTIKDNRASIFECVTGTAPSQQVWATLTESGSHQKVSRGCCTCCTTWEHCIRYCPWQLQYSYGLLQSTEVLPNGDSMFMANAW